MGAEKVGKRYRGKGALLYDSKRASKGKWLMENKGVEMLLPEVESVIDVPVGTGRFNYLYEQRGIVAIGVDTSPDMLDEACKKGMTDLHVGDIRHMPFSDKRFDAAVCVRLFAWFEPDEVLAALTEMVRVANTIIVNIRTKEGGAFCKNNSLWNHSRDDFRSWVDSIGYSIDSTFHVGNKGNDIHRLIPCA